MGMYVHIRSGPRVELMLQNVDALVARAELFLTEGDAKSADVDYTRAVVSVFM